MILQNICIFVVASFIILFLISCGIVIVTIIDKWIRRDSEHIIY